MEFTNNSELITQNPELAYLVVMPIPQRIIAHFDLDAFFGINNIGGTQYPIMIFVNQIPDAYMPAPKNAVVYGGKNLKYNFK